MSTAAFFFGGYNASQNDMDAWARSAKQQKPSVDFTGFPWPKGVVSYPPEKVVEGAKKDGMFKSSVDAIDASPADTIYILGHSSGCAIVNAVHKSLKSIDKVVLVTLDGFSPNADQLKISTTQVWGADCGKVHSKNYPGPSNGKRHIYHATDCTELWSLHFSVVNSAARDGKVTGTSNGYTHCQANLMWLC